MSPLLGLGYHRIVARLDAKNQGSIGIVERLKMRKEAHLIQNDRFNGIWGDEFIYATPRGSGTGEVLMTKATPIFAESGL